MSTPGLVLFEDEPLPEGDAAVIVDADDGSVKLWPAPDQTNRAYFALVVELGVVEIVAVAWTRPRGEAASYACAADGTSSSRDMCRHIRAATVAADEYERRKEFP